MPRFFLLKMMNRRIKHYRKNTQTLRQPQPNQPHQSRLSVNPADSLIKQSLFNVLKLLRPTVILDEAHKAYGSRNPENNQQFVEAVNRLNPRFVLELSATPKLGISKYPRQCLRSRFETRGDD